MKLSELNIIDEDSKYYTAFCIFHEDINTPNLKIQKSGEYAGHYKCWACGEYGVVDDMDTIVVGSPPPQPKKQIAVNWENLKLHYIRVCHALDFRLQAFADQLHVALWALLELDIGYGNGSYMFPVYDASRNCIGIMRRYEDRKRMETGSNVGLYIPKCAEGNGTLVICEGASDVAAMLSIHRNTIGMFNRETPLDIVYDYVQRTKPLKVIIFADGDVPGITGAKKVASKLMEIAPIFVQPMPEGYDVRRYLVDKPQAAKEYITACINK